VALPDESVLRKRLDGQHPHLLADRHGERQGLEAGVDLRVGHHAPLAAAIHHGHVGGVQSHLRAVEIVPLQRGFHDRRIGVASDPHKPRQRLLFQLEHPIEHAALGFDLRQVFRGGERVDMQQVQAVHLQGLEALFHQALGLCAVAVAQFAGQEDPLAASLEGHPDTALRQAVFPVFAGGIDVGDAEVQRLGEGFHSFVLFLILQEPATGAESQDGHARPGLAEHSSGQGGFAALGRERPGGEAGYGGSFEKFPSREAHATPGWSQIRGLGTWHGLGKSIHRKATGTWDPISFQRIALTLFTVKSRRPRLKTQPCGSTSQPALHRAVAPRRGRRRSPSPTRPSSQSAEWSGRSADPGRAPG